MVETAPSQVRGGFFVRYTQAGLLTQTFKRTSPSSRNKHPSDIAERHSANTATALCGILTRLPFSSARQPPHETFMTDFSIRATAKNVNKKRIKGAKVAAFSFFRRLMGCKTDFDRLSFQKACCPFSIFRTGDIAKKKVRL